MSMRQRALAEADAAGRQRMNGSVSQTMREMSSTGEEVMERRQKLYDDLTKRYPVNIGKAVSKKQREESEEKANDSTLVYGEIHFKTFALAIEKIKRKYGGLKEVGGAFLDVGSGTGKPVFAAMLLHPFDVVTGIEVLSGLHKISLDLLDKWNDMREDEENDMDADTDGQQSHAALIRSLHGRENGNRKPAIVKLLCADAFTADWGNPTLCFANSTCFSRELMERMAVKADMLAPGTFFITFTKRLPSAQWEVLEYERYLMSWGEATVYIQVRIDPDAAKEEL